jgi:serine/threonine-protein kinase
MGLPGGDPIAAALAAGETPSPEMVAASQEKEGLGVRTAIACFLALLVCLPPAAFLERRTSLWYRAPFANPPEALSFAATEILGRLGYAEPASDRAFGLACCDDAAYRQIASLSAEQRDAVLASHTPPVSHFWYRQHQMALVPGVMARVDYDVPANDQPGMIRLRLDGNSRLIALEVRPSGQYPASHARDSFGEQEPDSARLFQEAGLDQARFQATDPVAVPPMAFDVRRSWVGTYGGDRTDEVRVNAAWWQNRPVWFDVSSTAMPERARMLPSDLVTLSLGMVTFAASLLMAWYNVRNGRGDRRGASFAARLAFVCGLAAQLLVFDFVAAPGSRGLALVTAVALPLLGAAVLWASYTAVEPYVRRRAPDALISTARVQTGRFRDPLVASHVLVGMTVMAASLLLSGLTMQYAKGLSAWDLPIVSARLSFLPFQSTATFARELLLAVPRSIAMSLGMLLISVALQAVLRRRWIADIATAMLFGLMGWYAWDGLVGFANNALYMYLGLVLLLRFGFLALLFRTWAYAVVTIIPPSLTGWLAGQYLVALGLPIAAGAWALWVILTTSRPLSTDSAAA